MSRRKRQKTGMINKEKENNSMTQETQTSQQTVDAQQVVIPQESERIQRAEWIHEQVKLQREAEDEAWEKIMEEQKLLTERRRSIDADINSNRELKRYHEDCMEDITDQVYSLHGISVDKLEGIKEYKNALFRGEIFNNLQRNRRRRVTALFIVIVIATARLLPVPSHLVQDLANIG